MVRYGLQILSEIFLICAYPIFGILGRILPQGELESKSNGKNIIIVERWLTLNVRHLYWKYYLESKGFRVYVVNFPIWKKDFSDSANVLHRFIEKRKLDDVVLVGISSGALTSLLYLKKYRWKRIRRFVAIGAPFKGTWAGVFLLFCKSGWEILPNSKLIKKIPQFEPNQPQRVLCIRAKFDEMVPSGALLSGSKHVVLDVIGHNNLHLAVRATYKKIAQFAK